MTHAAETFVAPADGKDNTNVKLTCYFASEYTGNISPESEIEDMAWFSLSDAGRCSKGCQLVLEWLKRSNIID